MYAGSENRITTFVAHPAFDGYRYACNLGFVRFRQLFRYLYMMNAALKRCPDVVGISSVVSYPVWITVHTVAKVPVFIGYKVETSVVQGCHQLRLGGSAVEMTLL